MNGTAETLEQQILALIERWRISGISDEAEIDRLFVELARLQLATNTPYREYARYGGGAAAIEQWRDIPAIPASAFKDAVLASFPPECATAIFWTSGTTADRRGKHYFKSTRVYEAAAKAAFERLVLAPAGLAGLELAFLSLTPDPQDAPHSSLGHMVATFRRTYDSGGGESCITADRLDAARLRQAIDRARNVQKPVILFGTALALARLTNSGAGAGDGPDVGLEDNAEMPLPPGSIIVETGGFKGLRVEISQPALYRRIATYFAVPEHAIVAELGMTELSSQYYDHASSWSGDLRVKTGPPWLRTRIIDAAGNDAAPGTAGALRHYDLANYGSVAVIETEDLAVAHPEGFVFIGRSKQAAVRGCSLTAEDLRLLQHRAQ